MNSYLRIMIEAAHDAGDLLSRYFYRPESLSIYTKSKGDFVSNADLESQKIIETILKRAYPSIAFLAEEQGEVRPQLTDKQLQGPLWIVDPLDGTANFLAGIPHFCVSIALIQDAKIELAVIYDPIHRQTYTGAYGRGARLDDRRLHDSHLHQRPGSVLANDFCLRGFSSPDLLLEKLHEAVNRLRSKYTSARSFGAAALDLAYVASGQITSLLTCGCAIWDLAAGALIVREAGRIVTDFSGDDDILQTRTLLASGGNMMPLLMKNLAEITPILKASIDEECEK